MTGNDTCRHNHHSQFSLSTRSRLIFALILTILLIIVEVVAGTRADSLALITDAVHNLTDAFALALSFFAHRVIAFPVNQHRTYGYHRVGILVALINSSLLILMAGGVLYEAWQRYLSPVEVKADIMIFVGGVVLILNILSAWFTSHGAEQDLNLRSAFLHIELDGSCSDFLY